MGQPESVQQIEDDDFLIRRVRLEGDMTANRRGGGLRASSFAMQTRIGEKYLSCSLLRITSPRELLDLLAPEDANNSSWGMCVFRASDARNNGYEVHHDPANDDSGHCIVSGKNREPKQAHKFRAIARASRILEDEEIENPEIIS